MEYIDLHTGYVLLGFNTILELQQEMQCFRKKHKTIVFKGEPSRLQEAKAKDWVKSDTYCGYLDYNYPLEVHYKKVGSDSGPNKEGPKKAVVSIATAIEELERKMGNEVKYIIICRTGSVHYFSLQ